MIESRNPFTGELLTRYDAASEHELETLLTAAAAAQPAWAATPIEGRAAVLREAAVILRDEQKSFADLMTAEMGKVSREARAEAEKCAWVCEYYAERGAAHLAPEPVETDAARSYVSFEPLGVVLAVMPWNFPFWQVFRFAAPALTAGNGGILKHASNVSGCALAIEAIFRRAGIPEGVFSTALLEGKRVGRLIEDPRIAAVTLTGSTPAGRSVASQAGQALKKTVLELGGSDPYVVLEDADLEAAVETCVDSRLINAGQSCIAAKRFIFPERHRERCENLVVEAMAAKRWGDPTAEDTDIGPLARRDLRDELHEQVEASVAAGARCLLGGEVPDGPGYFYPPTVLTGVRPGMPAYDQELFGPVASLLFARDEDDALRIANDTSFGLGAAIFTRDRERGERLARTRLHAGACFVNTFVRSDPRLPFGGIRESGYGRELGRFGIREFVNTKTVYVA